MNSRLTLCNRLGFPQTDWRLSWPCDVTEIKNPFYLSPLAQYRSALPVICSALLMTAISINLYPIPSQPLLWLLYLFAREEERGEERRVVVNRVIDRLQLLLLCWPALPHHTAHHITHHTLNQLAFSTVKCSRMTKEEKRRDKMRRDGVSTPHHTTPHLPAHLCRDKKRSNIVQWRKSVPPNATR